MPSSSMSRLAWVALGAVLVLVIALAPLAAISVSASKSAVQVSQQPSTPAPAQAPAQIPSAPPASGAGATPRAVPPSPGTGTAPSSSPSASPGITQGLWLWQRTEYSDDTVVTAPDPSQYTITFHQDGRITLQADCNRGSGTYTLDGPQLTVNPGPITLIACPPGSQEEVFLQDLRNVATYVMDGENLVLNLKLDSGNMIFSPQPPVSLVGATWRVTSVNNGRGGVASVLPDAELTATFGADGNVSGNSGCNSFRGPYTITGDRISFGNLASTRRACLSEPLNEQEQAFLAALTASTSYELVGDRLTLRSDAGEIQVMLVRPSVQPVPSPRPSAP